jgi:hypothetical protein
MSESHYPLPLVKKGDAVWARIWTTSERRAFRQGVVLDLLSPTSILFEYADVEFQPYPCPPSPQPVCVTVVLPVPLDDVAQPRPKTTEDPLELGARVYTTWNRSAEWNLAQYLTGGWIVLSSACWGSFVVPEETLVVEVNSDLGFVVGQNVSYSDASVTPPQRRLCVIRAIYSDHTARIQAAKSIKAHWWQCCGERPVYNVELSDLIVVGAA